MTDKKEVFYKNPSWSFVGVILTVIFQIGSKIMPENISSIIKFWPSILAIFLALYGFYLLLKQRKEVEKNKVLRSVLQDIRNGKTDKECALWDYGKHGHSCVPYNDTWKEWISSGNGKYGLVVTVDRPDLDYYNFGEEFYFVDLKTNKKISIPTGDKARKEKVGSSFYDGMVVRLMPKNP